MGKPELLRQIYAAFNKRDVDGVLACMSEDVSWPKASEGGRVVGKRAIADYWARQWAAFDPTVTALEVIERDDGVTGVKVHQVVKDREGTVLSDTVLKHVYGFKNGLIARMDIEEAEGALEGASLAFSRDGVPRD